MIKKGAVKTVIFDMDGTIYRLDGDNFGFTNSTLQKHIRRNALKFFADKSHLNLEEALKLVNSLEKNKSHLSVYACETYGISRKEYFDVVWDVRPEKLVSNYKNAKKVIEAFFDQGLELILLTQAPKIWQERVTTFLGLSRCFSKVHTGESYISKGEVFSVIAGQKDPKSVMVIGDQYETDILPALEFGFHTFHVKSPDDLLELI